MICLPCSVHGLGVPCTKKNSRQQRLSPILFLHPIILAIFKNMKSATWYTNLQKVLYEQQISLFNILSTASRAGPIQLVVGRMCFTGTWPHAKNHPVAWNVSGVCCRSLLLMPLTQHPALLHLQVVSPSMFPQGNMCFCSMVSSSLLQDPFHYM